LAPELERPAFRPIGRHFVDVVGVLYPEEFQYRNKTGDGWIFYVRYKHRNDAGLFRTYHCLVRSSRFGQTDLSARIPELYALRNQKVAFFGLGCIGAPSALQLARSGIGQLRILDDDFVDAGPTVRWPLGISVVGGRKAKVLAKHITANYPYTRVIPFSHRVGRAMPQDRTDRGVLAEMLDGAELIYDASAEGGVQRLLSDFALEYKIPYLCVYTTPGAWGGVVARVRPELTQGCWSCLQYHFADGSIPMPPDNGKSLIQPEGCSSPTFTGASFDVEQIALSGVRMAVSTLSERMVYAYPTIDWDVEIISLLDKHGKLVPATIQPFQLTRHPKCQNH
jgi:hypothetical protein